MHAPAFWKAVTTDRSDMLEDLFTFLSHHHVRFCAIGGVAVNAYADSVVTLDLDLVLATPDLARVEPLLAETFTVERLPDSMNLARPGSDLRVQWHTDPHYSAFVDRAAPATVMGITMPVALVEDVLQGKVLAATDPTRRSSKRQKDLADIARLIEVQPALRTRVPDEILARLL